MEEINIWRIFHLSTLTIRRFDPIPPGNCAFFSRGNPMSEEVRIAAEKSVGKITQTTRRAFVRTATEVAVTAPAVSVLLAASTKMANAQLVYFCPASPVQGEDCDLHRILDDFTFGNNEEDLDAITLSSNFNPFNGTNNQDDIFAP
jgi:hypothetical protein